MDLDQVTLHDGRRVDTCTAGDPDGVPVLLQHGLPQSRLMAAHADADARACGVRLLSLSRPGFGASSRATPSLAERGDDAIEVVAKLGAERFAVLGVSFGAPFAAATALRGAQQVTALGIAGGMGPWLIVDSEDDDDPDVAGERRMLARFAEDGDLDAAMTEYQRMGHAWFDDLLGHEDDDEMMDAFDAMAAAPDEDLTWVTPEIRHGFARDVREALATYDGLALDNITVGQTWDIDPQQVRQPTFLWYGDQDSLFPGHAHWWKAQVPHAQLAIREGEWHGEACLTHWADMFDELAPTLR